MTVIQKLKTTRMAPYIGLMEAMTREEKQIVVMYLTESMQAPEAGVVEKVRRKYNVAESESTKWFRTHAGAVPTWNRQQAWEQLTDQQRKDAERLNLTAADMDERTVAIIKKHLR